MPGGGGSPHISARSRRPREAASASPDLNSRSKGRGGGFREERRSQRSGFPAGKGLRRYSADREPFPRNVSAAHPLPLCPFGLHCLQIISNFRLTKPPGRGILPFTISNTKGSSFSAGCQHLDSSESGGGRREHRQQDFWMGLPKGGPGPEVFFCCPDDIPARNRPYST